MPFILLIFKYFESLPETNILLYHRFCLIFFLKIVNFIKEYILQFCNLAKKKKSIFGFREPYTSMHYCLIILKNQTNGNNNNNKNPFSCCYLVAQSHLILCYPMEPARLLCPWDSPGKSTGVGYHSFLQKIFPTHQ